MLPPELLVKGNTQTLYAGMGRLSENSVVNIKNKSFAVTRPGGACRRSERRDYRSGRPLRRLEPLCQGGKSKFVYNVLGIKSFGIEATQPIPVGKAQVRMEFTYDGGGMGKGGNVKLFHDGKEVGGSSKRRVLFSLRMRRPTSGTSPARR